MQIKLKITLFINKKLDWQHNPYDRKGNKSIHPYPRKRDIDGDYRLDSDKRGSCEPLKVSQDGSLTYIPHLDAL